MTSSGSREVGSYCRADLAWWTLRPQARRGPWQLARPLPGAGQGVAMDTTSYLALSRQVALQRHMTNVANNLANATTTGYRAEHTLFSQVLERTGQGGPVAFVQDAALIRDLSPGPVTATFSQSRA